MSALDVIGMSAGYGTQPVVENINLTVESGTVTALFGANGAGKSTTLKAISGAIGVLAGSVAINGSATTAPLYQRARNGLSYVTEERSVFKGLTVEENLRVGGVDIPTVLALFPELEKRLRIKAGLISGGEQQMLSLGRAMVRGPNLILADELSLGLAPLVVTRLFKALRTAASETGLGVLLVEQHVRKALDYVDHVYVMRRGRVELDLPIAEAKNRIEDIENAYLSA
ncbi:MULTISPECIES: ABC transporter ATP-binding protein [Cryobacterium]|uniref:ATP-binding cassette domain-containing protein n=1 Tax=Cryobacterium levicorallinum TaxID=995038 RepID=A0A1I2XXZ8_9MICO|nr:MULTISPECIES: ATP-binding cassette domain-containing protein [Cryobacterium]TFB85062.1 ATP-binding cassette domain-containing protein [Cryobacterium levicorallinum]TFD62431.1 ATP-binding cassette domain-containing protein [Cryobacterium sp. Hh38]GEP26271.1 ABC transporter ATP-binding protein [Cryobacterium levicorallinum]SFH18380.1 branched-chain amino acid transport system ATP-binding protein [Cryobacterium levicorallinum]